MKGITHFLTGVATATCFPLAVRSAFDDKSYLILLGGLFGILCDTLDFKFARYFWKHDYRVRLTEDNLDPKIPAEAIARAIDEAAEKKRPVRIKMDILRVSTNYYRTYAVQIDERTRQITCTIGPLKTMSQVMERGEHLPGESFRKKEIDEKGPAAFMERMALKTPALPDSLPPGPLSHVATCKAPLNNTYYMDTEVGIFSGPDYEFVPQKDGKIRVDFIPWHRRWSHSVTAGAVAGLIASAFFADWPALFQGQWSAFANPYAITVFAICFLAFLSHVVVDQMGYLGCNLYPPFTWKRIIGWKVSTSSSPFGNQMVNYISMSVILWNLNAYSPKPVFTLSWARGMAGDFTTPAYYLVSLLNYAVMYVALPIAVLYLIVRLYRRLNARFKGPTEEEYSGEDYVGGAGDL